MTAVGERTVYTAATLQALDALQAPLWVFDLERAKRWWINLAGVRLWGAPDRAYLLREPMVQSEATRTRLEMYQRRFERDETITERWTIYPDGQPPRLIESTCSPILIDYGRGEPPRQAMLVEARPIPAWEADPLERRSVEALRHVGDPVTLYSPAGAVLLRNPAALRAFGDGVEGEDALAATFAAPADVVTARAALGGEVQRFDALLRTLAGERVHTLEVRGTVDPMTGEPAVLVCSRDIGERIAHAQAIEHSRQLLAAQAEELARLAAPVLRVWPGIVVLPLIGRVDRARMAVALEALTPVIFGEQVRAVIFDLTGAAFVDVETAESLRRALRVLGLRGCEVMVAGVLPELARLLVASDVQLGVPVRQTIADALRELTRMRW